MSVGLDRAIVEFDKVLRSLLAPARSRRPMPGSDLPEASLSDEERQHVASLMRVNHVGEICAQALYQGQALTSRSASVREALRHAAEEETEHLAWAGQRITELGGRKSLLNPLWYGGALAIGLTAGAFGDRWSLGFLAETERQVEAHLAGHLARLPVADEKTRRVIFQMKSDEIAHAQTAVSLGAAELPIPVKWLMRAASKAMTTTSYWF